MGTGGCNKYRHIIEQYDWNVDVAMEVCRLESQGIATASNWQDSHATCNGSHGLFQMACIHGYTVEQLYDPSINIRAAYKLWKANGWWPWTTYKVIARK